MGKLKSDAHLNIPKRLQVSFYSDLCGPNILRDHIPKIDPQVCDVGRFLEGRVAFARVARAASTAAVSFHPMISVHFKENNETT